MPAHDPGVDRPVDVSHSPTAEVPGQLAAPGDEPGYAAGVGSHRRETQRGYELPQRSPVTHRDDNPRLGDPLIPYWVTPVELIVTGGVPRCGCGD
jgi:hypothetical protein